MVVGGVAASFLGRPRLTLDVDVPEILQDLEAILSRRRKQKK
jgi:hypothetical protein